MAAVAESNTSAVANKSHEVQPLLKTHYMFKSQCSQKLNIRFPKCKFTKITEKGAIFMIIWNLFYSIALFCCSNELFLTKNTAIVVVPSSSILYPVVRLVIDVWIGTFRIIKLSLYFLLVAIIVKTTYLLISSSDVVLYLSSVAWSLAGICYFACHSTNNYSADWSIWRRTQPHNILANLGIGYCTISQQRNVLPT